MKRSDLSTLVVLLTVKEHGVEAIETLLESYPEKVILAAYRRDGRYLDYGVSERRPWITPEGERYLRSESAP